MIDGSHVIVRPEPLAALLCDINCLNLDSVTLDFGGNLFALVLGEGCECACAVAFSDCDKCWHSTRLGLTIGRPKLSRPDPTRPRNTADPRRPAIDLGRTDRCQSSTRLDLAEQSTRPDHRPDSTRPDLGRPESTQLDPNYFSGPRLVTYKIRFSKKGDFRKRAHVHLFEIKDFCLGINRFFWSKIIKNKLSEIIY